MIEDGDPEIFLKVDGELDRFLAVPGCVRSDLRRQQLCGVQVEVDVFLLQGFRQEPSGLRSGPRPGGKNSRPRTRLRWRRHARQLPVFPCCTPPTKDLTDQGPASYKGAVTDRSVWLFELREELERLLLLERVTASRQDEVERRLDEALEAGITAEELRERLNLSKESARELLELDATIADRLGITQQTVEKLER
jgi:hypothetical protein